MASPRGEETQTRRDTTGQATSTSGPETRQLPAPPHPHSPENHPPPYPPAMSYPVYPNTYPNYPNGPYNYNNHHYVPYPAQAPPATYYGSSPSPYPSQQYRRSDGFFRGILTGLIILVGIFSLSTIVTWLVLRPQIPVFSVTHFSVSSFNATRPVFSAKWTANLTVENPNTKLKAYFNRIQGFIYHHEGVSEEEDGLLATEFFTPMYVETKKTAEIGETVTVGEKDGEEESRVPTWVAEGMKKERERNGTVSFSLRMAVWVTFKAEGWWARETGLKVFCEQLKVVFENGDSGNGAVLFPKPLPCLVYV